MKILYFFLELPTNMYRWQRIHIIDELEHHGVDIETFNPLMYQSMEEANDAVISRMKKNHIDLFFSNVCYEKVLFPSTLGIIRDLGIPSLSLRCDNLVIPFNDKRLAPLFDLVWLTSCETKGLYDKWGVKSFFAPYAANPFVFNSDTEGIVARRVCFIGTPYGSRSIMINQLTKSDISVDAYYKKKDDSTCSNQKDIEILESRIITPSRLSVIFHRFLFPEGRKIMKGMVMNKIMGQQRISNNNKLSSMPIVLPEEQSSVYSRYALSLASTSTNHTDVLKDPLKIINLRNFEIPMSGGIEICKYNPELAEYFESGKEIVFYNDNEDLVDKAKYYLQRATDAELNAIKVAARKRAVAEHTWWNRFTKAFDLLGLKY